MRRVTALFVLIGFGLSAGGCNRVKGDPYADKVNEKMVAKINSGEVKSLADMARVELDVQKEALKEMGFSDPEKAKITESEKKKFEEKIKTYSQEWAKLLIEKSTKKP